MRIVAERIMKPIVRKTQITNLPLNNQTAATNRNNQQSISDHYTQFLTSGNGYCIKKVTSI